MKFRRIKEAHTNVKCVALVEMMQADPETVRRYTGVAMEHADVLCMNCNLSKGKHCECVHKKRTGSGRGNEIALENWF